MWQNRNRDVTLWHASRCQPIHLVAMPSNGHSTNSITSVTCGRQIPLHSITKASTGGRQEHNSLRLRLTASLHALHMFDCKHCSAYADTHNTHPLLRKACMHKFEGHDCTAPCVQPHCSHQVRSKVFIDPTQRCHSNKCSIRQDFLYLVPKPVLCCISCEKAPLGWGVPGHVELQGSENVW